MVASMATPCSPQQVIADQDSGSTNGGTVVEAAASLSENDSDLIWNSAKLFYLEVIDFLNIIAFLYTNP